MKLYRFEHCLTIAAPLEDVWSFFADPHNLTRITPPSLNLRVPPELPHTVYPGMIVTYTVRPFAGYRATWVTEITHVTERTLFVDEQRFGPYRFWHHQHHLLETDDGIEVRDIVHYALPLGPFGRLANAVMIRARLREIFNYRVDAIKRVFRPLV